MAFTTRESPHGVAATMDRAVAAVEARGLIVFARVDHGAGARSAGLELGDEELLLFGNPQVGTLLMQSDPTVGYELPIRLLAWESGGRTLVGYRPASELADDYEIGERGDVLQRMDTLMEELIDETVAPG